MTLALAALAVAVGAAAQSISGIGFSLVSGPLLFTLFGAREGVRVGVSLSLLVNVWLIAREHRHIMWRQVAPVLAAALVTTPVLVHLLAGVQPRLLRAVAGAVIVVGVAVVASGRRIGGGTVAGLVAGAASASMNVLASTGGPAVVVYATGAGWDAVRLRVTLQAYFFCLNVFTCLVLGLPSLSAADAGLLVVALLGGAVVGSTLAGRVRPRAARAVTLLLAGGGGVAVLVSSLLSG